MTIDDKCFMCGMIKAQSKNGCLTKSGLRSRTSIRLVRLGCKGGWISYNMVYANYCPHCGKRLRS